MLNKIAAVLAGLLLVAGVAGSVSAYSSGHAKFKHSVLDHFGSQGTTVRVRTCGGGIVVGQITTVEDDFFGMQTVEDGQAKSVWVQRKNVCVIETQ